jgi:hypothetical protein
MNFRVLFVTLSVVLTAVAGPVTARAADRSGEQSTGSAIARGERIAVLADPQSTRSKLALDDLVSYLQRTLAVTVRRYALSCDLRSVAEPHCLVFGPLSGNAALQELAGPGLDPRSLGSEGALLKSVRANDRDLLLLTGGTEVGACNAVYSFLENELGIGFFIEGEYVPMLQSVKLAPLERRETPPAAIRGLTFHHTWKHPYANNWRLWSFEGWRKAIDWMRRKRMNTFTVFHDEGGYLWGDVIFRTFPEIPKNDFTLSQFVVDPVWRTELNHQILRYARESGLRVAFNLFYSQVPEFFAKYHPELKYHDLNMRNLGIAANQPECQQIMKRYWKAILDTYGIDNSHVYLVCPYQHERNLPDYLEDHVVPTRQAVEVLKEIDPEAKIYIESWCWKYRHEKQEERTIPLLTANLAANWKAFDENLPRDVGVVEWDLWRSHRAGLPATFGDRPYIQLTHTNMEGWWPPATTRNHPRTVLELYRSAYDRGAQGVLFFHIQAGHTEILADLASRIGWNRQVDLQEFYRDYARRRFGDEAAGPMSESLSLYCDAADLGATFETADYSTAFTFPGFDGSAEHKLKNLTLQGAERKRWLEDRLKLFEPKARLAADAMLAARSVAPSMKNHELYQKHIWELDYLAARFEGIRSLYRAHLIANVDARGAEQAWQRAVTAFDQVKELFRDREDCRMSEIRKLEPDVPYTDAFLKDWETRGFWQPRVKSFHVVWERIPEFEALVKSLKPAVVSP